MSVSGVFYGGPNAIIGHGLLHPISAHHLVHSPFPQTCQPVLGSIIKSLLTSTLLGLLHPICAHLVRSPFPHRVLHGCISWVVWVLIECESLVTSAHHATHSASLALGVLPLSSFFFVFSFWFCFFGGFGGCECWPGSQPLSRLLS